MEEVQFSASITNLLSSIPDVLQNYLDQNNIQVVLKDNKMKNTLEWLCPNSLEYSGEPNAVLLSVEAEVWEWRPFFINVVLLHISTEAEVWEWLPFFTNVLTIRPQRALTNIYRKTISHWSHQNWRIHSICGSIPVFIDLVVSTKCIAMNVTTPYSRGIISKRNPELRE